MTNEEKLTEFYKRADEREKEFMFRLIAVYANGSEAGKKILHDADLTKIKTQTELWNILEAAETA